MRKTPYNYIVPKVSETVDFEKAPIECIDCIAHCQEGHIDVPCKGIFDCEDREELKKEAKENNNGTNN